MAAPPPSYPAALKPEIGPDGLARDSPVIAYTEKIILEEQLQLKKYIQENYSKIRDVEKELESLSLEMKLTAGPKKAALEHLRKKIEISTEKIRLAKVKEDQAKKAWEVAAQAVKDEEDAKQKLCPGECCFPIRKIRGAEETFRISKSQQGFCQCFRCLYCTTRYTKFSTSAANCTKSCRCNWPSEYRHKACFYGTAACTCRGRKEEKTIQRGKREGWCDDPSEGKREFWVWMDRCWV